MEVAVRNGLKEDEIYVNFICAIDTDQMKIVWEAIVEHMGMMESLSDYRDYENF